MKCDTVSTRNNSTWYRCYGQLIKNKNYNAKSDRPIDSWRFVKNIENSSGTLQSTYNGCDTYYIEYILNVFAIRWKWTSVFSIDLPFWRLTSIKPQRVCVISIRIYGQRNERFTRHDIVTDPFFKVSFLSTTSSDSFNFLSEKSSFSSSLFLSHTYTKVLRSSLQIAN